MRLLFVTQDFPPDVGGIQTYSWELARELSRRTKELEVIAPHQSGADAVDQRVEFRVTRLPVRPDLLPFPALFSVVRHSRRFRPHVVVHAQWQTVLASLLSRALTGRPKFIACAAHGRELLFNPLNSIPGGDWVYNRLRNFSLTHADLLLPVSQYTAGLLHDRGVPSNRTHVLSNGTDPNHFRPHDDTSLRERLGLEERPLLLTVGRLVPRKGIDTVIRALPAVLQALPDVAHVVVGTGPDRSRLEALAVDEGVENHVHFQGAVSYNELPFYYSTADLFVMPAREEPPDVEGFGIVFLEANACGTPVVGSRTGGIPDAIVEGKTGVLASPTDAASVANAIEQLLTDADRAAEMGRRGRERVVREATWDHVATRLFKYLTDRVPASRPPAEGHPQTL